MPLVPMCKGNYRELADEADSSNVMTAICINLMGLAIGSVASLDLIETKSICIGRCTSNR